MTHKDFNVTQSVALKLSYMNFYNDRTELNFCPILLYTK